eukprot:scaffold69619_cov30-Tisochrysis_lutea.AAC.2
MERSLALGAVRCILSSWDRNRSTGSRSNITYDKPRHSIVSVPGPARSEDLSRCHDGSMVSDATKVRFRLRTYLRSPAHEGECAGLHRVAGGLHAGGVQELRQSHGCAQLRLQFARQEGTREHGCCCASRHRDEPPAELRCKKKTASAIGAAKPSLLTNTPRQENPRMC